ncbi:MULTISPECIES: IS1380 family transposase [Micrococcales]|uniref:IS1380 family transposase n=1 Tax=Yaniella flava TaxID=287930 RepID=UPI0027A2EDD9|nr:IS1380 family transposase [Bacillus subtilis]WGP08014.1 IS1380 family transposase [Bacillus subtilis]WGP08041.1 IS1380 family transposase [Bacillus subtilis]WGP08063.1 IS1380 family transposase [Bacillus subtilis]WGP08116.1 IS1380 family transposase [Bacillus subtilis]
MSHSFDDGNLTATTGLVPIMGLAQKAGLPELADDRLTVTTTGADKGANPAPKLATLVAGMAAGADSIDDMNILRHGGMKHLFDRVYAPSTLGSFLRSFAFGHVRQLDAISSRFLTNLNAHTPLLPTSEDTRQSAMIFVDIDDTVIDVHSASKQGAGFGYQGSRGLNALFATASTGDSGQIIVGQRLRKGSTSSARGADKFVSDAVATTARIGSGAPVLVRADSAYYSSSVAKAARDAGADVSITVRMDTRIKAAIAAISDDAWTGIEYPEAIYDEDSGAWISKAEVAEVPFTAFTSKKNALQATGRLVVRRIPELNEAKRTAGQDPLFDLFRHHAFFTTVDRDRFDTVIADQIHRRHAIIEQINAELKNGALAHMPSGVFDANAAWVAIAAITHNLLRAAAGLLGGRMSKVRAQTLRTRIIGVPARIAHRARKLILHLPRAWPWAQEFSRLWQAALSPPRTVLS